MRRAAVAVIALLVLAGCSSSGSGRGTTAPPSSGQSPSTAQSPSTQSPSTQGSSTARRNVKSQLLTVSDLPPGWAVDNSSDSGSGGPEPPCLKSLKSGEKATDKADADFVQGTDFPILQQQLGYLGTTTAALRSYAAGVAVLNRCRDFSFTSDGERFTGTIGQLSFPKLGQHSTAWRLRLTAEGVSFGIDMVVVQKGPELQLMLYGDIGTPSVAAFASIARKAVAKMPGS